MLSVRYLVLSLLAASTLAAGSGSALPKGNDLWLSKQAFKKADRSFDGDSRSNNRRNYGFSRRYYEPSYDDFWDNDSYYYSRRKQPRLESYDDYDPEPDYNIIRKTKKNPERDFTSYQAEKLVPLLSTELAAPSALDRPQPSLASAVLYSLRVGPAAANVTAKQRDAILAVYAERQFAPIWIGADGIGETGRQLLALASTAEEDALSPAEYLPDGLASFNDDASGLRSDDTRLARLDLAITASLLRYAEHLYSGRIVPNKLSSYYDITPPVLDLAEALRKLSLANGQAYLAGLAPSHPAYAAMKSELAKLRAGGTTAGSEPAIAEGALIKVGQEDPRLAEVRLRLAKLGYGADNKKAKAPELLDKALAKLLKTYQSDQGLKATGQLNDATVKALNGEPPESKIEKLAINMERLRWLPRNLGEKHLFVNQAAFELRAMNGGQVEWRTKVVVGKPETQTAVFSDEMETVVLNPYWGVPKSILYYEMLPYLANDPYYLDRKGFEVVNAKGKRISSGAVDWWSYGENIPYDVRQRPGKTNALGNIKFLFPNSHDIYMHDTPAKKLFAKSVRAFSHGCVRVEDPRELARFVLGWDRKRIDAAIGTGSTREYSLERHVPVYLNYFTAWPTETGMAYYADIYERDARMNNALGAIAVADGAKDTKLAVDEQPETVSP